MNPDEQMRPGGPGGPMQPPRILTDEEKAELLKTLKTEEPELYNELTRIKQDIPERYEMMLRQIAQRQRDLENLKQRDPEAYQDALEIQKLEVKERSLTRQYREAQSNEERTKIEQELMLILSELFDLSLTRRQQEVKRLEEEIKRVKQEIQKRKDNKDAIIQKHFDEITGKDDGMRW